MKIALFPFWSHAVGLGSRQWPFLGSTNSRPVGRPNTAQLKNQFAHRFFVPVLYRIYKHPCTTLFCPYRYLPLLSSPMNALTAPSSSHHPVQLQPNQQPVPPPWEFTRRKRWADLLMTELSEAIVLVLSPRRKVLFCNPAVREILGWQDGELIDKDFKDFVNGLYPSRLCCRPAHIRVRAPQSTTDSAFARHTLTQSSVVKTFTSTRGCSVNPTPSLTRQ